MSNYSTGQMIIRVFFPFAFGYFLSYLYRVINAVIAPDLTRDLGLGPDDLGFLTASYFLTFAAFQLPLGVLLDRYGPRQVEAALLIFAALGACVFAMAPDNLTLVLGRALIGFGVSACLMASFKAFTVFYEAHKLPLVNGFIMAAGGLGALAGTAPTEFVVQSIGWRGGFYVLAGITLLCALIVFLLVPPTQRPEHKTTLKEQISGIKLIFTSRIFWQIAPVTMMTQASFISIQSLWVGPWHRDLAGMNRGDVADTLFWLAAAMVAGFLGLGALSERLGKIGIQTIHIVAICMVIFLAAQGLIITNVVLDYPFIWLVFSFFGTGGILSYAVLSQNFAKELGGRVNTAINLLVFVTIFILQSLSGQIIDLFEVSETGGYVTQAYQAAFGTFLILQLIAFSWFVLPLILGKKTNSV